MKKFIINLLIFSIFSFSLLLALDKMVTIGLKNSNAPVYENLTKIHKREINSNLIINGSSKAIVQVSTYIIDSILNVNSYNFGMNGTNFELQNLVNQLYRIHNPNPDYIIQIVSHGTFKLNEDLHEYKRFAPYLNDSLVKQITNKLNGFSFADHHFPFIRYSGFSVEILNGITNYFGVILPTDKSFKHNGYIPHNKNWDNSFDSFKEEYPNGQIINIDSSIVSLFNNYIMDCLRDSIGIILIYPPTYHESHKYIKNRGEIISLFESIANKNKIPFLDYSEDSLSYSKKYFYNSQHLNKHGAELFTEKMCADIKNGMKVHTENNGKYNKKKVE